jgi:prepilin-type processing-associated H-X9-DG protein
MKGPFDGSTGSMGSGGSGVMNDGSANAPLQSPHSNGANIVMCDGSARFLREGVDLNIVKAMAVRDDNYLFQIPGE